MTATKIYWSTPFGTSVVNTPLVNQDTPPGNPEANILDDNLDIVAGATNVGTVSISSGPSGAVLSGTTTVAAINGTIHFTNLRVDLPGTYNLRIDAPGLEGSVTGNFEVMADVGQEYVIMAMDSYIPGIVQCDSYAPGAVAGDSYVTEI